MKNAIESSVFFSIATQTDLKENHNVTIKIMDTVTDYFKKVTDQEFMLFATWIKRASGKTISTTSITKTLSKKSKTMKFSALSLFQSE